jgi:hypothetical protein
MEKNTPLYTQVHQFILQIWGESSISYASGVTIEASNGEYDICFQAQQDGIASLDLIWNRPEECILFDGWVDTIENFKMLLRLTNIHKL